MSADREPRLPPAGEVFLVNSTRVHRPTEEPVADDHADVSISGVSGRRAEDTTADRWRAPQLQPSLLFEGKYTCVFGLRVEDELPAGCIECPPSIVKQLTLTMASYSGTPHVVRRAFESAGFTFIKHWTAVYSHADAHSFWVNCNFFTALELSRISPHQIMNHFVGNRALGYVRTGFASMYACLDKELVAIVYCCLRVTFSPVFWLLAERQPC